MTTIHVPHGLLQRYDQPGPRYTSYPTAPSWVDSFGPDDHLQSLRAASERRGEPLSLYVHLPFCESMCWYCGCSVKITQDHSRAGRYVDLVLREADLAVAALGDGRPILQHHWGGGTPTFLPPAELVRLFRGLAERLPHAPDAEISIEVDPRVTTREQLEALSSVGFNRISMGVQDLDERVQHAIHRVQPFEQTQRLVDAARELGFASVNLDVVYGLPHQSPDSFRASLLRVLSLGPDRLACYGYAHVPWLKKHQRVIDEAALPKGADKLDLYLTALDVFQSADFELVGMDHFAKRTDALAIAANQGTLHRNFMGYTTWPAEEMVSFGMTSISEVDRAFAQNEKSLGEWTAAIEAGRLPVERGLRRSADDDARRRVILDLMCHFRLEFAEHGGRDAFVARYGEALQALEPMAADGLCSFDDAGITVTPLGRLFVRNLAMPFDAYLQAQRAAGRPVFSRTV
ncbi:MAG: oxygen-independent coproporphyrinogen III oxidase [Planctomycetes bacterium]|nr:oxygen-independent coproporphyrinogen III oxidase [Planctomycetota bacterium]